MIVMTERERLIQLIGEIKSYEYSKMAKVTDEGLADCVLANGVHIDACATCDYIKYTKEKGILIELMGKPIKYCPECGEKLER